MMSWAVWAPRLLSVLRITPLRQTTLNGVMTLVREFDALSINGQPIRMSAMLLQGPSSAVQCVVGISLYRWVEFAASDRLRAGSGWYARARLVTRRSMLVDSEANSNRS